MAAGWAFRRGGGLTLLYALLLVTLLAFKSRREETWLLARHAGTIHVITRDSNALHYRRWGFAVIDPCDAPRAVRRNRLLGQTASVLALLQGRRPQRLVVLRRD